MEVGNIAEISSAIVNVYENIDQYDINYLRNTADQYSAKNVTEKALEIYQEMIRKD